MKVHEGSLDATGLRFALVASRFNSTVTQPLVDGATDCLRRSGAAEDDIELVWVPGAWELPVVVRRLATGGRFDAIVALGAVIRGQTAHFTYVADQAAEVGRIAADTGVPVSFGVLTTETYEQAIDRAGGKLGNKGFEAAQAAVETARLLADLK
jgi:6,7-dimethyl-8-ribityllumazine synthase